MKYDVNLLKLYKNNSNLRALHSKIVILILEVMQ